MVAQMSLRETVHLSTQNKPFVSFVQTLLFGLDDNGMLNHSFHEDFYE